ncbi:MAG: nicotinamide-nucleotide amidohydrolase family protein [Candidatus Omnitrophota bacterium]|jgi:nicotinamide-nucleotide amidase
MRDSTRRIHSLLLKNNQTLAAAESCTAGLLSYLITRYPGSSKYFLLGVSAYSNKAKETLLGIPHRLICLKGAVSKEVAVLMAQNARRLIGADFGIGITGIAGPDGATRGKPVGTVFIAVSGKGQTVWRKFIFRESRGAIRKMAALESLQLLETIVK